MEYTLECKGLTKIYSPALPPALDNVSLALPKGQIVGLLGPNGSGKTTLIKIACGLLRASGGELRIGGEAPGIQTKAMVSYLPDKEALPGWMKVARLVAYFADFYADFDAAKALDMLGRLEIDPARPLKTLSKGTKEKVQLVLMMSRRARLYLLDEPIGGVDPAARDFILETILTNYDEDATVVISTHLIADIERVLDRALFLQQGRVQLDAGVDEIRQNYGKSVDMLFREVFKC